jgi:two-component system nitrogen regulation response regulator GlnG
MSAALQTRLLRVLAEGEFYRVGGQESIRVDVRIIAATNQDLNEAVHQGRFREDLFYRLNVIRITTPPLRERREDIPLLLQHYLSKAAEELGVEPKSVRDEALRVLQSFDWPGNVRQLINTARRFTVIAPGSEIGADDVPAELGGQRASGRADPEWVSALSRWAAQQLDVHADQPLLGAALPEFEKALIQAALQRTHGRRQEAAQLLGWGRNTLARKIKELNIEK